MMMMKFLRFFKISINIAKDDSFPLFHPLPTYLPTYLTDGIDDGF